MARELIQKIIDSKTYEFQQFNTTQSLKMLSRLAKICGEPLALAIGAASGDGKQEKSMLDRNLDPELLSRAVKALCERLDENVVVDIVKELTATYAMCDGKKILFDNHYEGDLRHLFQVLSAALEVQYGNFFGALLDVVPRGITNRTPTTPDPQT